MSLSKSKEHL